MIMEIQSGVQLGAFGKRLSQGGDAFNGFTVQEKWRVLHVIYIIARIALFLMLKSNGSM